MPFEKKFDCVKMKNKIQEQLLKQRRGMNDSEIDKKIRQKLQKSQSPVAKLWRVILTKYSKQAPSKSIHEARI